MIARIHGFRDRIEYVALHIDDSRDRWVTVRGDRGASGEQARTLATAGRNLERLLDEPTEADDVDMDGDYETTEPP